MDPEAVECAIERIGIGFMFAPTFHPAMKHVVSPRKEIGIRTVFNVLGPLINPASANTQLLGVYDQRLTEPVAYVLKKLGCEEAMVVHGLDGLDEISIVGKTTISWLREGEVSTLETVPRDFGVNQVSAEALKISSLEESIATVFRIITGFWAADDPKMEMVLVNSAAGIVLGGKAENFLQGMEMARESAKSGAAYAKLKALIRASGGDLLKLEELESKYA
jgi:anthranilate phosphoribosyltransferase